MKTAAKEQILKKVKEALKEKRQLPPQPDFSSEIYISQGEDLLEHFVSKFMNAKGTLFFCENEAEFTSLLGTFLTEKKIQNLFVFEKNLQELLSSGQGQIDYKTGENTFLIADAGLTGCECLISRTGGMFISSATESGRRMSVYSPVHIVLAYTSQLVKEINDGINLIKSKYDGKFPSMISMTTGPSRTADIEKTLVLGAHGPKELVLFLIDDSAAG